MMTQALSLPSFGSARAAVGGDPPIAPTAAIITLQPGDEMLAVTRSRLRLTFGVGVFVGVAIATTLMIAVAARLLP